jgi:hypothetical protein
MKRNRVRLKDSEAIALGFTLSKTLDDGNSRYRLTPEQEKDLQLLRNFYNTNFIEVKRTLNKDGEVISKVEKLAPDDLIKIPDNHEIKRVSTNVSTKQQWVITEPIKNFKEISNFEILSIKLIEELKNYSPSFPKLERVEDGKAYLLVVDPADIHIGKLCSAFEVGESYNNQIAVQRVLSGVRGLLDKSRGYKIDKILFIGGNDILHIDSPKRITTSGTNQDTDGMWHTNFLIAKQLYVDVIEMLLSVADVHFDFNPSNHDYTHGFFLAQVVETHFRLCENITFNTSIAHRKGFQYFNNFIGTTHGDGAKMDLLPSLFTQEHTKKWCNTKHRYIYTHHIHHKTSKDYVGVTIESLRSPSGTDSWHHRNGYEHAPKAVEGFLHCKENGQVARLTHIF